MSLEMNKVVIPFGPIGYIVYKRTYARRLNENSPVTEEFEDTIKRIITACNKQLKIGFTKEEEAELTSYFLSLKGIVAGRFLWQLGTKTVDRLGLLSLQNCAFTLVNEPIRPFIWAMDALLLGSGVGYNIQKEHVYELPRVKKVKITRLDTKDADFIVPDSRQGWIELLRKVLEAHFITGEGFSYSTICVRGKGSVIKGFGGLASGPEELCWGMSEISKVLNARAGKKARPIDCLDIMNIIGYVVVSGNVRRCLPKGSFVHAKQGLVPIENIKIGDEVLTTDGYRKVLQNFKQGIQDTITIKTQDGLFECTPNHKMAVLSNIKEYTWKEAKDIIPGDRLISTREAIDGIETSLPPWEYNYAVHSTTCQPIIIPKLDTSMAWFIGIFQADGYTYINEKENGYNAYISLVFGINEWDIANRAKEQIERFGLANVTINKRKDEESILVRCISKQLALYMHQYVKKPKISLDIPQYILTSTIDIRLAYLAGLADGDGALHNKPVLALTTVYGGFAKQIQSLFYSCGIETRLNEGSDDWESREGWQKIWNISLITLSSKAKFNNIPELMKDVKLSKKSQCANSYPISFFSPSAKIKRKYGLYTRDQINIDSFDLEYGFSSFCPVEVVELIPCRSVETFDIEVEEKHEFFCNGYLTHNSAQIAIGDMDDLQFLSAKRWDTGNIPSWRAMSNNSVVCNDFSQIPDVFWEGYNGNGEPYGLINLTSSRKMGRVGETQYPDPDVQGYNPCQPAFATVLTPDGVKTFNDIDIGSKIWSKEGWTTVIKKWSTGIKPVYNHKTTTGVFVGTENHMVDTKEGKVEVKDAEEVLTIAGPIAEASELVNELIMDGLFLGDGYSKTMTDRDYTYPVLCIGEDDQDYFDSEIAYLIGNSMEGYGYRITTSITSEEKKRVYEQIIPDRLYLKDHVTTRSLLRGIFSANGSVTKQRGNSVRVKCKTTSKVLSEQIQIMLSSTGIRSYITTNKSRENEFKNGTYVCKESYDINITKDFPLFFKLIGFIQKYKMTEINKVIELYKPNNTETYGSKKEVEYLGDFEVFDITVDNESHTYWTGGLSVSNCAEQSLADKETCCLAELFLPNITSEYELRKVIAYLYRINKHSLMLDCHLKDTEAIVHKNMRMGIGVTGYLQATEEQRNWLPNAYLYIRQFDKEYSAKHGFNESIKITTVKPSGTLSLLAGVTPGAHPAYSRFFTRRMRIATNSDLIEVCKANGYPMEYQRNFDGSEDKSTMVVSFPCSVPEGTKLAKDMTAIDQLEVIKRLQTEWSDNSVSVTIYYRKEELEDIKKWLTANYNDNIKTVSFLLHNDHGFQQPPLEEITEKEYLEMRSKTTPITGVSFKEEEVDGVSDCASGACPIK